MNLNHIIIALGMFIALVGCKQPSEHDIAGTWLIDGFYQYGYGGGGISFDDDEFMAKYIFQNNRFKLHNTEGAVFSKGTYSTYYDPQKEKDVVVLKMKSRNIDNTKFIFSTTELFKPVKLYYIIRNERLTLRSYSELPDVEPTSDDYYVINGYRDISKQVPNQPSEVVRQP